MTTLAQDLRFALRLLGRRPGFTAVAVLTLALGIGVNSAVFSLVDAVLLRPLGYSNPDQLVWLWESNVAQKLSTVPASPANFADWREQSRSFREISAWRDINLTLTGGEFPERLSGARVLPSLLDVLGAPMALGRRFGAAEGAPGGERVAIITYGLWQRRFGGDPALVGQSIRLDGFAYTVAGVLGREFEFPFSRVEVLVPWLPDAADINQRGAKFRFLRVVARLREGTTLAQARTEMTEIARRIEASHPAANRGYSVNVMPFREFFVSDFRSGLTMLLGAAALVLLISCINVANLLVARAVVRRQEICLRAALGAGRGRLLRQLFTESLVLGLAGGVAGIAAGWITIRPLLTLIPEMGLPIPGLNAVRIDLRAVGFTFGISLVTSILFGLAPIALTAAGELHQPLKEGGRGGTGSALGQWLRSFLVVCEVALAVVLSVGAGLVMKSFSRIQNVDPGFRAGKALTLRISLPQSGYAEPERQRAFFRQLAERFRSMPGAVDAAFTNYVPLTGAWSLVRFTVDGRPSGPEETPAAVNQVVTPSYFRCMELRLVAGRFFTEQDDENAPQAAIVSEKLARRYLPGVDPIGQRLRLDGAAPESPPWIVVGVVGDVHHLTLHQEPMPELYRCYYQAPVASMSALIRTASDPLALSGAARKEVAALDPLQAIYNLETMEQVVEGALWLARPAAVLCGAFSALALLLAAVGIYGLVSHAVEQRTREIGLRAALGASPGDLMALVLRRGLMLAATGVAGGLISAWSFARVISGFLFNVAATDPAVYLAVPVVLLAVAAVASFVPAARTARSDPAAALRHE